MKTLRILGLILSVILCGCGWRFGADSSAAGEPIPAGDLRDDVVMYQFAVYYLPTPTTEPVAVVDSLLKDRFSLFKRAEEIDENVTSPTLAAVVNKDPQKDYTPPDRELLQRFGYGISEAQVTAIQTSQAVLLLDFAYSKEHTWDGLRAATELASEVAKQTGGLVWDETTRETFSPEEWNARRLQNWTETTPEIAKCIVIHAYPTDEYVRAITLGMSKFGLPDVVIEEFPWSLNRDVGNTLNVFAQAIAEQPNIQRPEKFDLDLKSIKNSKVREAQLQSLKPNATGVALLSLDIGTWEEGDPENRLVEISFRRGKGPDMHAKREQILIAAFGFEDAVTQVKHDEELLAVSRAARAKLPALRAEFQKGLAPGEYIQVKAPFDTPDGGQEWMWVEVSSWQGDNITGLLNNEPQAIPSLKAGQQVQVSEAKVFDYIRKRADGTMEGNETAKIIQRMSGGK